MSYKQIKTEGNVQSDLKKTAKSCKETILELKEIIEKCNAIINKKH